MDVNAALDRVRRRKSTTDIELTQSTNDPENALYDEQRADILRHALSRLPERDGRLFALYYFGDLTHAEVGKRLDMTENAVSVALHRLRQRLTLDVRSLLDTEEGDPEK
jgi:RNA polymerase sigma factor (sigma-70 family)